MSKQETRSTYDSALALCSSLVGLLAMGCAPQAQPTPAERSEFRAGTGTSTGTSTDTSTGGDSTSTGGGFDCEGQPAGWPSSQAEIIEAFESSAFATRQCAYEQIQARICSGDTSLNAALETLADPANGYGAEVRARAQGLLGATDGDPSEPSVGDISIESGTLMIGRPPGWLPPESSLPGDPQPDDGNFATCELRIWDYLGGDRAEAILQDTYGPSSADACGNGGGGYSTTLELPCPAEKYEVEVICESSSGASTSATSDVPADPSCEEGSSSGSSSGDGSTGDFGSSSGSSSTGGSSTGGIGSGSTTGL